MITSALHFLRKPLRNWHLYRNAVHNHMTTIGSEDGQTHEAWIQKEPEETHSASKGPVRGQI